MRSISTAILLIVLASSTQAQVISKIDPALLKEGGKAQAIVVTRDDSRPGGLAFRREEVSGPRVLKLSADTSVVAILPNKPIKVPPVPGPRQSWFETSPWGLTFRPDQISPAMWMAKEVHNAPRAWAAGFTGKGAKIAVVDEGIDWGHPDLQGCQARITDPASPYYGWPIAFEPAALYIYATYGTTSGGYVDTSDVITPEEPEWRGFRYTLPGTSKSGVYHIGPHGSYWLPYIVGRWGYPVAVLAVDEQTSGVYNTVYVDLNKNGDFTDDKPCRRGDEISYWDADGDGLADYSAGMLYFVADGINPIPASDWLYNAAPPENGSVVCFAGSFGKYDAHGTLVASAIAAKGRVGSTYEIPQKPGNSGGMVYGVAPGAGIIQVGSIYDRLADLYDAIQFCVYGYDGKPGTGDEADIVNMSFGISSEDMDGWDFLSRYITYLNNTVAAKTTFVASIGNGGPGYGTVSSPGGASSAVTVGAATLYGSTDLLDPIMTPDQILSGDVQQWSDRGPSSLGQIKPEVVAVGAWATGDTPIYGSGENSWAVWAGTSLSAPITSGILSLVYEAYRSSHGEYPTCEEAKTILMSGAKDLCYHGFEQGAGLADAARSTEIASGTGGFLVRPSVWAAGSYGGAQPESFPHVMKAGERTARAFAIENTGPRPVKLIVGGRRLVRTSWTQFEMTTRLSAEDQEGDLARPDYLADITRLVPPNTDLLRIRVSFPYGAFTLLPPSDLGLRPSNLWMVSLYDWTDLNHDKTVWKDLNRNRVVNDAEFQTGEMNRFMLANPVSDVIELSVREPFDRVHSGLFLGLIHSLRSLDISSTRIKVELEAYREVPWEWLSVDKRSLTVPARGKAVVPVVLHVPESAVPGIYAGSLVVRTPFEKGDTEVVVPVSVSVLLGSNRRSNGTFPVRSEPADTYDNTRMFPSFDWGWREESGDWRFFFMDVPPARPGTTSYVLANAGWLNRPSDTDILLFQPEKNDFFSSTMPEVFGPHGLTLSATSRRTWQRDGLWLFQTATRGPAEWVAGEAKPGLNLIQLHNVLASGNAGSEPFSLRTGQVFLEPGQIEISAGQTSARIKFTSTIGLKGLSALSFGLKPPQTLSDQPISQNYPYDPKYASWTKDLTVADAGMIDINLNGPRGNDLDLYLLYDANSDGYFEWSSEVLATSATPEATEHIRHMLPVNGKYRVAVHGYSVPGSYALFSITMAVVDGKGVGVKLPTGAILPGVQQTLDLSFTNAQSGAVGLLYLGPTEAPGVLPVRIAVK